MPLASNLLVLATAVPQSRSRHNLDACTKLNKQRNPRTTKLYTLLVYLLALHTNVSLSFNVTRTFILNISEYSVTGFEKLTPQNSFFHP